MYQVLGRIPWRSVACGQKRKSQRYEKGLQTTFEVKIESRVSIIYKFKLTGLYLRQIFIVCTLKFAKHDKLKAIFPIPFIFIK